MAGSVPAILLVQDPKEGFERMAPTTDGTADFITLRDFFRYAVSRFNEAKLAFGHGTTNALDEAAFMLLEKLHLPIDRLDPFLDARLTPSERNQLDELIEERIATRKPAAYLLNRAYIQGRPFYVDERVIVPRSFIGELLFSGMVGEEALIHPSEVGSVLDLCTGGGSLAILAEQVFPKAWIDAVDLSADALAVARRNVEEYGLADLIALHQGDLYAPVGDKRYDLILTNPPYVDEEALNAFPPEFSAEPRLAHDGGRDGLDVVRRIVNEAGAHLTDRGALVCEIGRGRVIFERDFPSLSPIWLDAAEGEGEVLLLRAKDLQGLKRKQVRK
jgi:ribosomal protein L3 glutamine methyltransferase